MITWTPILHVYQPPTQEVDVFNTIIEQSYRPFIQMLLASPQIQLTLNIQGSFLQQLKDYGHDDIIADLKRLASQNQIEVLSSLFYHSLVPLSSRDTVQHQISRQNDIISESLGISPIPILYPPELAISPSDPTGLDEIKTILVDESSISTSFGVSITTSHPIYVVGDNNCIVSSRGLTELLRGYPERLDATMIHEYLERYNGPVISVNDIELFGHHYEERQTLFKDLTEMDDIIIQKLSTTLSQLPQSTEPETTRLSTWSTRTEDLEDSIPLPIWNNPNNTLQQLYIEFMKYADELLSTHERPIDDIGLVFSSAEKHAHIGYSSCHLYWLSNFPWWHPNLAEEGSQNLIKSIRSLPNTKTQKLKAEEMYRDFLKELWNFHWENKHQNGYNTFDKYREQYISELRSVFNN